MNAQRAFAYLRCSGKSQIDGDSFPRQRAAIDAHAASHDLKIVRYFEEAGVSGKTEWDDRPAWLEMISAMNGVRTIVIERLDRLARDLGVQEFVIRDLAKRKIELISTAEPDLGTSDPTRVLFRQIMGAVSAYDRSMIEAKLRAARDRIRKRTGKCEGRKEFGAHPDYPHEKEVLAQMLDWHRRGFAFNWIANKLRASNVSTRGSRKWYAATVSRIVRREVTRNA